MIRPTPPDKHLNTLKILYIGHYAPGSTSRMRGEYIKKILQPESFNVVDIDIPMSATSRLFKSIGWRYKFGPLIDRINNHVRQSIDQEARYDVIWVDKGVFIRPQIMQILRGKALKLIHFTPDPAFLFHHSRFFEQSLPLYDCCITTKSFEIEKYYEHGAKRVSFCTQGFDPLVHHPLHKPAEKQGVAFIGHREDDREWVIASLLQRKIPVKIAGVGWKRFAARHKGYANLNYMGEGIFGRAYTEAISGSLISLGFLSRIIPEKHTTRTFEIPACRTALVTEKTEEIRSFYEDDEVLFFNDIHEVPDLIEQALKDVALIDSIAEKGYARVRNAGFDYESIMRRLLQETGISRSEVSADS